MAKRKLTSVPTGDPASDRSISLDALDEIGASLSQAAGIVYAVNQAMYYGKNNSEEYLQTALWGAQDLLERVEKVLGESTSAGRPEGARHV